ncbi:sensor histidine kinase [Plantactinospora sp. KLBMP9567]|uniref:sensor histidine kinase n=1 Tax=Plantactinospora sp. KLBMP9567 TaxID=3085900 RepID=UPI00298217AF|nr:sensor histidine kinase [Plantactinospora sp. KLBMP9567]MDW5330050.1 sensor histidine kinase [Plantactinospora sp. KLBMP9567]
MGLSFVLAGLVGWRARPGNRTGPLLVAVGLAWWLGKLPAPLSLPDGLAVVRAGLWAAVLAHLVVAFPSGRLATPAPRLVVGSTYLGVAVVGALTALRTGTASGAAGTTGGAELAGTAEPAGGAGGIAIVGVLLGGSAVVGLQLLRWRRSSTTRRRYLNPMFGAAVLAVAMFVVVKPATIAGRDVAVLTVGLHLGLLAVPLGYLAGLLRRRVDRGGVADLVVRLHAAPRTGGIAETLSRALHDPTLRIGYWTPESGRYVDIEGRTVTPPEEEATDRAVTRIDRAGEPVAILVHDRALAEEPELIEATCAAAGLALENERLTADLRARVRQLADSRLALLRAGEAERRRLERDLHDGVQQRLLAIPLTLGLAGSALPTDPERAAGLIAEARSGTLAILAELRALTQGLHPPLLTERGLAGAVRELAALSPVPLRLPDDIPDRLPAEVETTAYYVVAEALANITKHAAAASAELRIGRRDGRLVLEIGDDGRGGADPAGGSGLRGLADRVAVVGGSFELASPAGGGTRIRAVLPCG